MARNNYIFIDFESIQETELERLAGKPAKAFVIVGEQQKKIPLSLAKAIGQLPTQIELIETGGTGRNAADMVLAYRVGLQHQLDPAAYIHIISRDKDFDTLINHLKSAKSFAARHESLREIPLFMNAPERVVLITERFKSPTTTRAATRAKLESQIQSWFGKSLTEAEVKTIIGSLVAQKTITIAATGAIQYRI